MYDIHIVKIYNVYTLIIMWVDLCIYMYRYCDVSTVELYSLYCVFCIYTLSVRMIV